MAEAHNNANYVEKDDIVEVIQRYIHRFDWRGEQVVLDIGCGRGEITQSILLDYLPETATLIGFDASKEMIDYCNKFRKKPRLSFNEIDIQYVDLFFSWKREYFHKIFSFYCIQWMENFRRSLCNMYTLLKFDGDLLLIFLTPKNPMYRAFEILKERYTWQRLFSRVTWFYETRDPLTFARKTLEEIGFTNIYCQQKLTCTTYPSLDAYLELIEAINPYTRGLPEKQIADIMKSLKTILKRDVEVVEDAETGEITVHYSLMIAVAKKRVKREDE